VAVIDTLKLPAATITSIADTTLCSGPGSAVKLRVTLTGNKNWDLTYTENGTPLTVNGISSGKLSISRTPSVTSGMQIFNYALLSLADQNGCLATVASLTGTRKANIYRTPVANAGPDAQVCGPVVVLAAVPSDGTGTWTFVPQVLSGTPSLFNTQVKIDSSFTAPSVTYSFTWTEQNWTCTNNDAVNITFFNRIDTISAGTGGAIMSFDNALLLKAYPVQGPGTGTWSIVSGSGTIEDPDSDSTYVTGISTGSNTFKWTIQNGACMVEDLVTWDVSLPVIPMAISPNGDPVNEELEISGLDFFNQKIDLSIISGAGTPVFSTSNREGNDKWMNWTGRDSKGRELPEGTYYFLLKVESEKVPGKVSKKSGFIILKRQ
jgi:hypothetical protein